MTKKLFAVVFIISVLGFCSCSTANPSAKSNEGLDARGNIGWDGVYTGTIPGADSGINAEITLKKDGVYNVSYQYIDKSDDVFIYTGTFVWMDNSTIKLDDNEIPPYYLVGENTLTQLNMLGEKIDGEHADNYVLRKK